MEEQETYDELLDEAEDELDESQDLREDQLDSFAGTYPEAKERQDIYNWFWRVVRLKKPFQLVKVGFLTKDEIGANPISVRDAMNLWILGNKFHHKTFGNYFATVAKITSVTSMSKKGWFMDLSISQKRVRERAKVAAQQTEQKWRVFKKKGQQP